MRKNVLSSFSLGLLLFLVSCSARSSIPIGEIPKPVEPTAKEETEAAAMETALRSKFSVSSDTALAARVNKVAETLLTAAGSDPAKWQILILDNDSVVNAAVHKGNKIYIWSGIFKYAETDGQLATVIGHELGHLLAQHQRGDLLESLSKGFAGGTAWLAKSVLTDNTPNYGYRPNSGNDALGRLAVGLVMGVTSWTIKKVMVEPESRRKEYEADTIGLFLMKKAGYNPEEALSLWSRFAEMDEKEKSLFSIPGGHPASKDRLESLRQIVDKIRADTIAEKI